MPDDIRTLRLKRKIRQKEVAAALRITDYEMRKFERGLVLPPPPIIRALARFFGVSHLELERAQKTFAASVAPGEGYTTAIAHASVVDHPPIPSTTSGLTVLDLFCGAGGLSFGLELTSRFQTIAALDLLPDRVATFRHNHPHATVIAGDIRDFSTKYIAELPTLPDVVIGGPPCQGFSSIRPFRTLTEGDKRNTLIEDFLVALSLLKPRWFVFENVVGVLTHHRGALLQSLLDGFRSCGYQVSWRVLNAALYGVPQNRERLVIVGNRVAATFVWPKPLYRTHYRSMAGKRPEVIQSLPLFSQDLPDAITVMQAIADLPPLNAGHAAEGYCQPPKNDYQAWARQQAQNLTLHDATRHSTRMLEIIRHAGPNVQSIPADLITSGFSSCYSRLDPDKPSTTLTVNFVHPASNRCIHPTQDRALTPREGARIQSFPDSFTFRGTRAQVVKQIGNAVPPLLAKAVGEAIASADTHAKVAYGDSRPSTLLSQAV